jgi:murein hydrolase activator
MPQWTKYLLLALFCSCSISVFAQSKEELQNKKEKLEAEIKLTTELLDEAKKEKTQSINTLSTLKRKIAARDEMISTLGIEIGLYTKQISLLAEELEITQMSIAEKQQELASLKEEYAQMIYHAYSNRGAYDRLAFIFSAQSFHQAYKRIKFFQQYSQFRQQQALLITEAEKQLEVELLELKQTKALLASEKNKKTRALGRTKSEKKQLNGERGEQQGLVNNLHKKEKTLKQELLSKEQKSKALEREIRKIIEEEIRRAKEAAKSTGTPSFSMTPEQKELSDNFTSNKGKLPWPVERGVITGSFGRHKHPVLAGIETFNNGVKITTEKGATARAVFEGKVSKVISIPGAGKAIIVSHGDYFSVYSNLSEAIVKSGDVVKTKQEIGMVTTNPSNKETITELQIWKGDQKLDPAQWLYRAY